MGSSVNECTSVSKIEGDIIYLSLGHWSLMRIFLFFKLSFSYEIYTHEFEKYTDAWKFKSLKGKTYLHLINRPKI